MNLLTMLLLMSLPAAALLALYLALNRWGTKRDPMGGSSRDILSTTGTQSTVDRQRRGAGR